MSRRLVLALLGALVGYVLGVTAGTWIAALFLAPSTEAPLRAEMAGVFVLGPLLAVGSLGTAGTWRLRWVDDARAGRYL
jgi:predicted lysophospholipase L1 biosynthesis ABC-type transport system permease subunit